MLELGQLPNEGYVAGDRNGRHAAPALEFTPDFPAGLCLVALYPAGLDRSISENSLAEQSRWKIWTRVSLYQPPTLSSFKHQYNARNEQEDCGRSVHEHR